MNQFTETHLENIKRYYFEIAQEELSIALLKKVYAKVLKDKGEEALYSRAAEHMSPAQVKMVLDDLKDVK